MKGKLKIHNAVFYAYHGVMSEEQNLGRKFEVDVEIDYDITDAVTHDRLEYAINYEQIYKNLKEILTENKFYLVEKIAYKIGQKLLEKFPNIDKLRVRVRKLHPPVGGLIDFVEAEVKLKQKTKDE